MFWIDQNDIHRTYQNDLMQKYLIFLPIRTYSGETYQNNFIQKYSRFLRFRAYSMDGISENKMPSTV